MADCLFCRILSKEIPSDFIFEDENVFAFRDISPQAPIHVLIVPKKHIPRVENLVKEDCWLVGEMVFAAKRIAQELNLNEGYRLVFNDGSHGQQSVEHLHLHLLGGRQMLWPPG